MGLKGKLMLARQEKNISFQKISEYLMEDRDYSDLKVQNSVGQWRDPFLQVSWIKRLFGA